MNPVSSDKQMLPEQVQKKLVSPFFIFVCMGCTLFAVGAFIYSFTTHFTTTDLPPSIEYLTPAKMHELKGMPTEVRVGLCINNFRVFDFMKNDFTFDGMLWFEFDPSRISLHTVEQFSFYRGEILYKSAPFSYLSGGKLFVRYDIRVRLSTTLNYKLFPVDDHKLAIVLMNKITSPNEIVFQTRNANFIVMQDMKFAGWAELKRDVDTGYMTTQYSQLGETRRLEYPVTAFVLDYSRGGNIRNVITIVLPMLLLFFIALFSLILDRDKWFTSVISIPIQCMTGLVAYRFVMEAMSPAVGYFMYSDVFFFLFLFLTFCVLLINTIRVHLGLHVRHAIIIAFCLIIMGVFWYLLRL